MESAGSVGYPGQKLIRVAPNTVDFEMTSSLEPSGPFENPFAAPEVEIGRPPDEFGAADGEAERIRREHIVREANVKGIGALFLLGGVPTAIITFAIMVSSGRVEAIPQCGLGLLFIAIGLGLRGLKPLARWAAVLVVGGYLLVILYSAVMMASGPLAVDGGYSVALILFLVIFGINGFCLWTLVSSKARVVFSPEYREIIRRTPHVKLRTTKAAWIALGIVLGVIAVCVVAAMFS